MTQAAPDRRIKQKARKLEKRALKTGDWGEWFTVTYTPKEFPEARSWVDRIERAHKNDAFAVLVRTITTPWGQAVHAAIRNVSSTDIPWAHKQRIKNELFGPECWAVEIFPPAADLVDAANMYHLVVFGPEVPSPMDLGGYMGETEPPAENGGDS